MINNSVLKKISFIIAIIGIAILIILLNLSPKQVQSLENEKINEKIKIQGTVTAERDLNNFKILTLGNIEAVCNCKGTYKNKQVEIIGLVQLYNNKKQIQVLEIKVSPRE